MSDCWVLDSSSSNETKASCSWAKRRSRTRAASAQTPRSLAVAAARVPLVRRTAKWSLREPRGGDAAHRWARQRARGSQLRERSWIWWRTPRCVPCRVDQTRTAEYTLDLLADAATRLCRKSAKKSMCVMSSRVSRHVNESKYCFVTSMCL